MNINDIERKKVLVGEFANAICNLANIAENWNDAQEEPDERGRGNGAIGIVVFEDGSGYIADFQQSPNADSIGNGFMIHRFSNPEEARDWFMDNLSARSL